MSETHATPKTTSVDENGEPDGFQPPCAWYVEVTPRGTRLVVSVPTEQLPAAHVALVSALRPPLAFRYIQTVDRTAERPGDGPERHFITLDLSTGRVIEALQETAGLIYGDGRCTVAIRGKLGAVVVLDEDGVLYTYPDDPTFRDALSPLGVPEVARVRTMADVDYPMRHFHAENDAVQAQLIASLGMTEIAPH